MLNRIGSPLATQYQLCLIKVILRRGKPASYCHVLLGRVEAKPDITMPDLVAALEAKHSVRASPVSLSRFLCWAGFTFNKTLMASERAGAAVREQRRIWINRRRALWIAVIEPLEQHVR